jgi:hypothetical protein
VAKPIMTTIRGQRVRLPSTIAEISAALPEADRAEFEREACNATVDELFGVLARWALRTPQAHDPDEDALIERLRAGDFTGITPAEEIFDDTYRSAG